MKEIEKTIREITEPLGRALCEEWELAKQKYPRSDTYAFCLRLHHAYTSVGTLNTYTNLRRTTDHVALRHRQHTVFPVARVAALSKVSCFDWTETELFHDTLTRVYCSLDDLSYRDEFDDFYDLDQHALWHDVVLKAFEYFKANAPEEDNVDALLLGFQSLNFTHLEWDLSISLAKKLCLPHWVEELEAARVTERLWWLDRHGPVETTYWLGPTHPGGKSFRSPKYEGRSASLSGHWRLTFCMSDDPAPVLFMSAALDNGQITASATGLFLQGRYECEDTHILIDAQVTRLGGHSKRWERIKLIAKHDGDLHGREDVVSLRILQGGPEGPYDQLVLSRLSQTDEAPTLRAATVLGALTELAEGFSDRLLQAWNEARATFADQTIYAFTLRNRFHFDGFCCAINTREHLASLASIDGNPNVADEAQCDRWFTLNAGLDAFEELNWRLELLRLRDDYDEIHAIDLHAFWRPVTLHAFESLKRDAPPEDHIDQCLLGYQQPAPSHLDWTLTLDLAEALCEAPWRDKLRTARALHHERGVALRGETAQAAVLGPRTFLSPPSLPELTALQQTSGHWRLSFLSEEPAPLDTALDTVLDVVMNEGRFTAKNTHVTMEGHYEASDNGIIIEATVVQHGTPGCEWTETTLNAFTDSSRYAVGANPQMYGSLELDPPRALLFELQWLKDLEQPG